MKWLFGTLLILVFAVIIGLWAYQDSGYVLIARGYKTVEMSLSLFIVLLALGFLVSYFALRLAILLLDEPSVGSGHGVIWIGG